MLLLKPTELKLTQPININSPAEKDTNSFSLYCVEMTMTKTFPKSVIMKITLDKYHLSLKSKCDAVFSFIVNTEHKHKMKVEYINSNHSRVSKILGIQNDKNVFGDIGIILNIELINTFEINIGLKKMLLKQSEFINFMIRNYHKKNSFFVKTLDYFYTVNNNWFLPNTKILVCELKSNSIIEEKCYMSMKLYLKYIFSNRLAKNSFHKKLVKKFTVNVGKNLDKIKSVNSIDPFIKFFNIDMNQFIIPIDGFKSFNEFFARKLKNGVRNVEQLDGISSPADCRIVAYKNFEVAKNLWIKGKKFSIFNLLKKNVPHCSIFLCRLAPQDYHRFHSPATGIIESITKIDGNLITVHPLSVKTTDVLTENMRVVIEISTDFGIIHLVAIGAALVGCIKLSVNVGDRVNIMDELGWFEYGGSTILLVFEIPIKLEKTITINSFMGMETLVDVGDCIGTR